MPTSGGAAGAKSQGRPRPAAPPLVGMPGTSSSSPEMLRVKRHAQGAYGVEASSWWRASERAFGGQLVAHCVCAAGAEHPGAAVHSVQVHFVAPSRMADTAYAVRTIRKGRSFSLVEVRATEVATGALVVAAMVGLLAARAPGGHTVAPAPLHGLKMPDVPGPHRCRPGIMPAWHDSKADGIASMCWQTRPVNRQCTLCWIRWDSTRAGQALGEEPLHHTAALAFMSDLQFLWTAYWPHETTHALGMITSLDHSVHFHCSDFEADSWLLVRLSSPHANGERAFVSGHVWTEQGALVATMAQEGVMRVRPRL
mmetsp:Transcript_2635/g.8682  ORF Transcript_2635/g.8682 Transcript_2635/m.8682 type:complete len:311 (-) Transcript_2635:388-1320(-)